MTCVYALARPSPARVRRRGLEGGALRTVDVGALVAIVEDVRRPPEPTHENLAKYHDVEEDLARAMTILPARFGTVVSSVDELTTLLRPRQLAIQRALAHVRGRAQMTVRLVGVRMPAAAPSLSVSRGGPAKVRPSGTEYLRAVAAKSREVPEVAPVRSAVARWVRDERVEVRDRVVTIYHLVPRGAAHVYTRALRAAADRLALSVVVTGPWAPYAFSET